MNELLSLAGRRYGEFQSAAHLQENSRDHIIDDFIDLVDMVPDLIALAERQQEMLVEATAEKLYPFNMPRWERLPDEDFSKMMFSGLSETFHGKNFYREQARKELSIQKRPRLSELERDAIEHAITTLDRCLLPLSDSLEDEMAIKVLRKMLEEE